MFGSNGFDVGRGVAVAPGGRFALTGAFENGMNFGGNQLSSTNGSDDLYVAVFEQDGTHVWSKRWGDNAIQEGTAVAFDEAGDVIVTGINYGRIDFGGDPKPAEGLADLFVVKLDGDTGAAAWTVTFADQNNTTMDYAYLTTGGGRIFLANANNLANLESVDFGDGLGAGHFAGVISWGDVELVSGNGFGGRDGFVAKLAP